ncbi:MAG: GHMP family kinase ATP-binding protein [Vulcanimicrobiaceae bacterium]
MSKTLPEGFPRSTATIVRSRAPLRISFCGGGTDVSPYPERFGGVVLSCTIDKYAFVSLRAQDALHTTVTSQDLGVQAQFNPHDRSALSGKIDLAEAIVRRFGASGLECYLQSDAPPGSGLGSSSAMIVALIAALAQHHGLHLTPYEVAELAVQIEREDLGIAGGLQDQFAAAHGGFNLIEFNADGAILTPLRIRDDVLAELHLHLLLCSTGGTRFSANILAEQIDGVERDDARVLGALHQMKRLTYDLKTALLRGRIAEFGSILDAAWNLKRTLASGISNRQIEEVYGAAKRAGAIGGKLLGAGGGGYMLFCVPFSKRSTVRAALETLGAPAVDFQFDFSGAITWATLPDTWT